MSKFKIEWPPRLAEEMPAYSFQVTEKGHVAEIWSDEARATNALNIPDNERSAPYVVRMICEHGSIIGTVTCWTLQECRLHVEGWVDQLVNRCDREKEESGDENVVHLPRGH